MTYGTVLADTLQTSSGQIIGAGNATGFKNKLINGNFNINQRAVSGTVTLSAGAYGHDRWKAGSSGCTYTFSTTANVTTLTISAGSLQQVIEGVNLQSGTYVLSWTGTAQGKIASGSYGSSGSVTASITGGTDTTIEFNTGTLSLAQLEVGSTATSFDVRDYGRELIMCQRYFEIIGSTPNSLLFQTYAPDGTSLSERVSVVYKVTKRASPTATVVGTWSYNNGSSLTVSAVGIDSTRYDWTASGAGRTLAYNINSGAYLSFSAEL